jgi:hypothetical protein
VGDPLGDRAAFGSDLRELAMMHPQGVHGMAGTQSIFHDQAILVGQHGRILRELNDLVE